MIEREQTAVREIIVREAREEDVSRMTEIYNQGILDRHSTLELEPHSVSYEKAWFLSHGRREPILAAEHRGQVIGYAALSRFSARRCHDHVKDLRIYIAREWRGKRIGGLLLGHLIQTARDLGVRKVVLSALLSNEAGMRLYKRFGFRTVGVYEEHGYLDGEWADMVIMEKLLTREPSQCDAPVNNAPHRAERPAVSG
ncbi:MAG: N-acetyltransferase [Armatimonadetes bacterium]|nr:N-acetyltransferase [Armatimonadota bacterium]